MARSRLQAAAKGLQGSALTVPFRHCAETWVDSKLWPFGWAFHGFYTCSYDSDIYTQYIYICI